MTYVYLFIAAVVIIAAIYLLIKAARDAALNEGLAQAKGQQQETAREAEKEMTNVILKPTSPEETKDKLKKGTF